MVVVVTHWNSWSHTCYILFFFEGYGEHRDLHVLTHSFPTRRSSDLLAFTRHLDGQTVLVAFNLSDATIDIPLPTTPGQLHPLDGHGRSEEHTSDSSH